MDYIDTLEECLQKQEDSLTEKSRDLGVTWLGMAFILNHFLFDKGFTAHLGSQKEEYVDKANDMKTLFEKLRYILFQLPTEFIPAGFNTRYHSSFMKLYNPENGNLITGESSNKNFGRQARASVSWMDEFAHWDHAEESWTSISLVTPVKYVVSTPKGRYNCFSRLRWHSKIRVIIMDWKDDPRKNQKWYDTEKNSKKYTTAEFAQEIDRSYSGSSGARVIPEFDKKRHIKDYICQPHKALIRSIDFGKRHPATTLAQMDKGIFHQFYELIGSDIGIRDWTLIVKHVTGVQLKPEQLDRVKYLCSQNKVENCSDISHLQTFPSMIFQDFCDQAGTQKSDKSNQTSIEIITGAGFKPSYRWAHIDEGLAIISKMFLEDLYLITPACILTKQAFDGGYHKDDNGKPYKDGLYDNIVDSIRYIVQDIFSHLDKKAEVKEKKSHYETMVDNGVPEPFARWVRDSQNQMAPDTVEEIRQKSHDTGYCLGG